MTWQTGENYTRFRKYILSQRGILKIINLPFDVFEAAYIDTCIYLLSSKSAKYYDYFSFDKKAKELDLSGIKFDKVDITQISSPDYKLILDNDIGKIIARFSSANYTILGDITKSTQGLSGSNFKKTNGGGQSDDAFPFLNKGNAFNYFLKIEEVYNTDLSDKQNLKQFYVAEPKVLIRRIINRQNRLTVTYCNQRLVFKKDINPFIPLDKKYSAKFLLAVLASSFLSRIYLATSSIATKDDFRQTTLAELRKLPIPKADPLEQTRFENKVDIILTLKNQQKDSSDLEREVDVMVYKLYNLSYTEVRIVDPDFWLNEEEYDNYKLE